MATASADEAKLEWPELYGFWIYGNGPTYVIYVEPTSISETAGIRVGDRIIELDNTDMSKQSADFIKYMAKNSKNSPPAISVQSYSKEIELVPSMSSLQPTSSKSVSNFGFNIKGEMPVIVDYVLENSPAWSAGLRANDIIVEVNNKQLKYAESLRPLLNMNTKLKLKYIPTSRNESEKGLSKSSNNNSLSATAAAVVAATSAGQAELHARKSLIPNDITEGKLKRAQNFYATLNQVFPNEPDKRKFILNELRKFTELGDMYRLASSLNSVLVTPPQRTLLNEIKPFIPTKQQALFENLTSLHNSSTVFGPKTSLAQPAVNDQQPVDNNYTTIINKITPYIQEQTRKQSAYEPNKIGPLGKRRVILKKNLNENYGFALKGSKPVIVDSVNQSSIASAAGLMPNDVILSINGVNVEDKTHRQLVELLSLAETSSVLEVIQKSEFENYKSIRDASASQNRESASASNRDSSLDLLNYEGKSFKEKVKEVLSPTEKHVLKKILLDYNNNKDVDSFLNATTKMLDTKTKKSLWFYLLPILEEEHQGRVEKFINLNKDAFTNSTPFYTTVNARLESKDIDERPAKSGKKTVDYGVDDDDDADSDHVDETRSNYNPRDIDRETYGLSKYPTAHKMSKQYSSAPSLISLNNNNRSYEDSDLVMKFLKQLEYLLNYKERSHVKQALKAYNGDKNIGLFVDTLDKILDTPAKRTLWFHIMPLLDEDDQEYAKRKLCLLSSRDNQSQYDQPASSSSMSDKQQQRSMSTKKEEDDEDEFYFYSHDNDQRSVDGAYELNEHRIFPRLRTRSKSRSGLIDPDDDIYLSSNDKFQSQKLTSSSYKWQDSDEDLTNVKINRIRSKENLKKQPTHDYVMAPNMTTSRSVVKYLDSANDGSYRYSSTKITTLNEEKHQYEYEAVLDNSDLSDYWPNKPPPAPMSITSEKGREIPIIKNHTHKSRQKIRQQPT